MKRTKAEIIQAVHEAAEALIRCTNQQYPCDPSDPWKYVEARQVLHDAMICLKFKRLIKDYNFTTGEVT